MLCKWKLRGALVPMAVPQHGYRREGQRLLSTPCGTCAHIKECIHGMQTMLKRKRQSGSTTEKEEAS